MKILIFIGTRPELIKLYPLILEFRKDKSKKIKICFTGQHDFLLRKILKEFKINPSYKLRCKNNAGNLNILSSKLYQKSDQIIKKERPNLVIVQGDTTSSLVCSIVAFHNKIKIAHVEAGLRSHSIKEPFPEEFNRLTIAKIADFHFAPTKRAVKNLIRENVEKKNIFLTGNTIVDALEIFKTQKKIKKIKKEQGFIFVTCHRRENYANYEKLIENILIAVKTFKTLQIRFLTHPGILRFKNIKKKLLNLNKNSNVKIYYQLSYFQCMSFISNSKFIISDSGGIQEEAPSFKKFVFVIRNYTERIESIENKVSKLIKFENNEIFQNIKKNYNSKNLYKKKIKNPYGDGMASRRIKKVIDKII